MQLRALITGGYGFLARHVRDRLVQMNYEVVGLVRQRHAQESLEPLYDSFSQLSAAESDFDVIFHLGAFIPGGKSDRPDPVLITSNIELTSMLALRYPQAKMVFASSVSVYGLPASLPITTKTVFNTPGYYGLSKLAGEAIVINLERHSISRFTSIIGKGMTQKTFVNHVVNGARDGLITVYGTGARQQNYIDANDAARLCIEASLQEKSLLILGVSRASYSNLEVATVAAGITGAEIRLTGQDDAVSYIYDVESSYESINFEPKVSLKQSIQAMLSV